MGELKRRGQIWWIRYYKNGKRYEESSGSAKEAEVKSLLRLREGDIERGVALTPKVGRIRVDEAAKDVVNDYRTNRKRSLDDVERRIELHLKPFFGDYDGRHPRVHRLPSEGNDRPAEGIHLHVMGRRGMCQSSGEPSRASRMPRSTAS